MVIQMEQIQILNCYGKNDVLTANYGSTSTVNVLSNDDFLAGSNTSITKTGGTAGGTVSFNASTGVMSYTQQRVSRAVV
jgi:hypothetical protein